MGIVIRSLASAEALESAVDLQKIYWGEDMGDLVPQHMLLSFGVKNDTRWGKSRSRKPLDQVLANQRIKIESPTVKESIKKVGAGGYWKTIGEKIDKSIVKQFNSLACVPAVGEMLLKERGIIIDQKEIAKFTGIPVNSEKLADYLNSLNISEKGWLGGFFDVKYFDKIVSTGTWGAVLREGNPLGHLVMVTGIDKKGLITINDPFDQTSYRITKTEFLKYSSEFISEKK